MRSFRSSQEEKKAKENEFWRKKARDEVAAADNEAEKIKVFLSLLDLTVIFFYTL